MTSQDIEPTHALYACAPCKQKKRRCDKTLPKCSLCLRTSRPCVYDNNVAPRSSDDINSLQSRIEELEVTLLQKNQQIEDQESQLSTVGHATQTTARSVNGNPFEMFPAMFFLDNDIFRDAKLNIPKACPPIPQEIYDTMGGINGLRAVTERFFATCHQWLPILSKRRFDLLLSEVDFLLTPDFALVFSAMRLLMSNDESGNANFNPRSNMYWMVKNYAAALEADAVMTIHLLQAMTLLAVYELGHAIYPAAYLSIGRCAVLGKALGLDNRAKAPRMIRRNGVWCEIEETKRLWWAILLLDRYAHLGIVGSSLNTDEPRRNETLPSDDSSYDQAQMSGSEPLYVTSMTSVKAGPFTRTCQAAHLTGNVITLLSEYSPTSLSSASFTASDTAERACHHATAVQIHRTLTSFVEVVKSDFSNSPATFATPMALAYSALITLIDPFCCIATHFGAYDAQQAEFQLLCVQSIKPLSDEVARFASRLIPIMNSDPASISPFLGNALYMATITHTWRIYEGERDGAVDRYRVLRQVLSVLNRRWKVGGEYLGVVDKAKETAYESPLL